MSKSPSRRLPGRVVAITGGARGIGRATAELLVRHGASVAIGDIDVDLARKTADELGDTVLALPLDVTDRASFDRFFRDAESALGPIDVLINNAGIMPVGAFHHETEATAKRQVDINVHGVLTGMKIALDHFLPREQGHIVNLASVAGKFGFPGIATYAGTKHFVVGVTEAARLEYRGSGIEFTLVMPNIANTELGAGVQGARFIGKSDVADVAAAIVDAIAEPRFDVSIPSLLGPLNVVHTAVPRPVRDFAMRLIGADKVLVDIDTDARSSYIERTGTEAATEPATRQGR